MKARPILMHGRSIRSLLAEQKTQTRRIVGERERIGYSHDEIRHADASGFVTAGGLEFDWRCPKGQPGDLLYVRETWQVHGVYTDCAVVRYRANERNSWTEQHQRFPRDRAANAKQFWDETRWRPSIHMPRWASRITLHLTDVRVERVQEISEADARDEGITEEQALSIPYGRPFWAAFSRLWEDTNGAGAWDRNDWCWVLCFEVIEANVDDVLADPARYGIGEAA